MDSDDKILINIFIDKEFKFSQIVDKNNNKWFKKNNIIKYNNI